MIKQKTDSSVAALLRNDKGCYKQRGHHEKITEMLKQVQHDVSGELLHKSTTSPCPSADGSGSKGKIGYWHRSEEFFLLIYFAETINSAVNWQWLAEVHLYPAQIFPPLLKHPCTTLWPYLYFRLDNKCRLKNW